MQREKKEATRTMARLFTLKDFPSVVNTIAEPDWQCAPCGVTPKSNMLAKSNFDTLLDRLDTADPYGKDWDYIVFNHWTADKVDMIFVRPGSKCAQICDEVRQSLGQFPALNEDLWVKYEGDGYA